MRHVSSLLLGCVLAISAVAQTYTYTKVADTSTALPSGTGNITSFSNMVSVDAQGHVAFYANGSSGQSGIYYWNSGALARVADLTTSIPSGSGAFTGFSFFGNDMENGKLVFRGNGNSSQAGLYVYNSSGGTLTKVVDTNTAIPGGTGNFGSFGTGYIDGTKYAFISSDSGFTQQGVYVTDGTTVTKIADKTTTVPGVGGTYGWSSQVSFHDGNISFPAFVTGSSATQVIGAYVSGTGLVTLASTLTTAPGTGTTFTNFNNTTTDIEGSTVYFAGAFTGGSGIYSVNLSGSGLTSLVDTFDNAPGHGVFTSLTTPVAENGLVYFGGNYSGGSGIYFYDGAAISKIIDSGDMLDGKALTSLSFFPLGVEGLTLAFRANFANGSSGIYTTQLMSIPEPSTCAAFFGLGAIGFVVRRRRRA